MELAVKKSKTLEARLKRELQASGESFNEVINSVEGRLPDETFQQLHNVREMRNDVVHKENHNSLKSRREFNRLCAEIERTLDSMKPARQAQGMGCVFTVIVLAAIFICLLSQSQL